MMPMSRILPSLATGLVTAVLLARRLVDLLLRGHVAKPARLPVACKPCKSRAGEADRGRDYLTVQAMAAFGLETTTLCWDLTSVLVHANGSIHAADAVAQQAQADVTIAYNDAAGRAPVSTVATDEVSPDEIPF